MSGEAQRDRAGRLAVAGACAGAITKTCIAPLDRLKTIFQTAEVGKGPRFNLIDAAKQLLKDEGVRGFFRGNGVNCLRVMPTYAIKFALNDLFKEAVLARRRPEKGFQLSAGSSKGAKLNMTTAERMACGSLAGFFQIIFTYPLDLVRTRLQLATAVGAHTFSGMGDCFARTIRTEGPFALYKGLAPTLLSGVPYVGLQMTLYDAFKGKWREHFKTAETSQLGLLVCGSTAGVLAQSVSFPFDTVRHCMQANGLAGRPAVYKSTLDCFRQLLAVEGVRGLYRGGYINVLRATPGCAIQFYAFDMLKALLLANAV